MSSHHIVREKQEPALYIHQLGAFNEEYLGQLLEWSPMLIVSASTYEKVISLGLKVDIVVNASPDLVVQENTKHIGGNVDDLQVVLEYLVHEKYPALNIINADEEISDFSHYIEDINIVLFSLTDKAYAVKSGFKVWKPAGHTFKIEVVSYFEASNLEFDGVGEFVVVKDGFVEFTFTTPYLFISEPL
jgi:hypothetical protein